MGMKPAATVQHFFRRKAFLSLFLIVAALVFFAFLEPFKSATVQVKMAWDPSPDPRVTGYKIYYSSSNWDQAVVIDVGNRTEYTVEELAKGVTYRFAATAYGRNGDESSFSNVVTYNTGK